MQYNSVNIIGAGAIGHLWFSYLSRNNNKITLYAKDKRAPRHLDVVSKNSDVRTIVNYQTIDDWNPCDLIIICVKAYQLEELCTSLKHTLISSCPIILMMNGLGLIEIAEKYLKQSPIYHAFLTHGAYLSNDKLIHAGQGKTSLGKLSNGYGENLIKPFINMMNDSLPPVTWSNTHKQDMHIKLMINAVINPLTALAGELNGFVLTDGQLNSRAEELFNEILMLKDILGIEVPADKLKEMIETVALKTAKNRSSMLQDITNQKPTEIDFINGYLLNQAKSHEIDLPLNSKLVRQIKALEASYIKK